MKKPSPRTIIKFAVIVVALILFLLPLPARFIEQIYTNGFYSFLQRILTPIANVIPFAIIDVLLIALIIGLPAWWIVRIKRAGRGRRWRMAGGLGFYTMERTGGV